MDIIQRVLIVVYLICAVLAYGMALAIFRKGMANTDRQKSAAIDLLCAVVAGLIGPVGLVVLFVMSAKDGKKPWQYGFLFAPATPAQNGG